MQFNKFKADSLKEPIAEFPLSLSLGDETGHKSTVKDSIPRSSQSIPRDKSGDTTIAKRVIQKMEKCTSLFQIA